MKKLSFEDLQNKLHRVVEIYAPNPLDPDAGEMGSGFAVTDNLVLTAKHIVQNAKQVRVRGLGEEWPTYRSAEVLWLSKEWDAALVSLTDTPWSRSPDRGESGLRWVHLSGQAPLPWIAYGFPRVTQFPSGLGRELEAAAGDIIPGAGFKRGILLLNVKSALPLSTGEDSSPWQGFSGAAILTEQNRELVGLIFHDPPNFETSRLQGILVEHLLHDPTFVQLVGVQTTEPINVRVISTPEQELLDQSAQLQRISPLDLPLAHSLIGRDEKLAQLVKMLRAETTSGIFSLVGMTGIGKTALAAEVVSELSTDTNAFPRGVAWVSCEDLKGESGLTDLWTRIARACDLTSVATEPDPERRRFLLAKDLVKGRRILLALDNIEPGLDAETICTTLYIRHHTVLLLTARQHIVPYKITTIKMDPLGLDEARTLFLKHFLQAEGTELMTEDHEALVILLGAVDGLPLALELTANYAKIQNLRLTTIVQEIESDGLNAPALRDSERTLLKRFERSWMVLSTHQQQLFAGLSLLTGSSFPRMAAMALAVPDNFTALDETEDDPKIALPTLINYALVEALPGGKRLRLHQLLRKFAVSKLETLSQILQERIGDAMVAYWLEYAQAHQDIKEMDALEAEIEGLKGAVDWAYKQARYQELLDLAHAHGMRNEMTRRSLMVF